MRFFQKTKGVISIFLIMIMLPLFTSAVLLVDGTRYHSAKMIAQEAGDLAAYSTIANYNVNLKDQYGLFAIDDVENISSNFEKYFRESLGYSASDAKEYSQIVQNAISNSLLKDGKYKGANFFNMYNFQIDKPGVAPEHPLNQPGVLQNQIVEYTKYRGLETILERFEIINALDKLSEEQKKNEKIAAKMKEMSEVDTIWGDIAKQIDELEQAIDAYDKNLASYACVDVSDFKTSKSGWATQYENSGANEMRDLALKKDKITKTRSAKVNKIKVLGQELIEDYQTIAKKITSIQNRVNNALVDYKTMLNKYGDDPEMCEDIRETIQILEKLIGVNHGDEKYSIVAFKKSFNDPTELVTKTNENIDKLEKSFEKTYKEYDEEYKKKKKELDEDDLLLDSEKEDILARIGYNIYLNNGAEWYVTSEDKYVKSNATDKEVFDQTIMVVREYNVLQYLQLKAKMYRVLEFDNYYEVVAQKKKNDMQDDYPDMPEDMKNQEDEKYVDGKINEANGESSKEEKNEKNVTIEDDIYKALPSKTYKYKKSDGKDTSKEKKTAELKRDDPSGVMNDASDGMSFVSSLIESGRNDILTFCYMFEMFNTRLSETEFKKPANMDEHYLADWRYKGLEKDFRDRVKKVNPAKFRTNEVEYIFAGNKSETANATIVYSWIYGTRLANNLVAVYSNSMAKAECEMLAAASSLATGGTVPVSVFKWIYIAAWAAFETGKEMSMLIDGGYKVPLIKDNDLFIDHFWQSAYEKETLMSWRESTGLNVSYEDYLLIMLCFVGREKRLLRTADLIELNMPLRGGGDNFKMSNAYTYMSANTNVKIKYMFQPVKQFTNSYEGLGLKFTNTIHQGY